MTETPALPEAREDHCAKWSRAVLARIAQACADEAENLPGPLVAWDPFAGVGLGRLRAVMPEDWLVLGGELEPEWAQAGPGTLVADALRPPLRPASVHVLASSPSYGNRFADQYDGSRDRCTDCGGRGCALAGCDFLHLLPVTDPPGDHAPCERCEGTGRAPSRRSTYRISLGREASPTSSTGLHWHADRRGNPYRDFHRAAWAATWDVLAPGALALVNVSDFLKTVGPKHDRRQVVQHVVEWHLSCWLSLGALVERVEAIGTPRMRHGQNHEARVAAEHLLVMRKPTR